MSSHDSQPRDAQLYRKEAHLKEAHQGVSAAQWARLVEFIITSYVKRPEAVVVTGYDESQGPLLVVEVDDKDRGQVIGREGRNLQSLERAISLNPAWRPLPRIELQG